MNSYLSNFLSESCHLSRSVLYTREHITEQTVKQRNVLSHQLGHHGLHHRLDQDLHTAKSKAWRKCTIASIPWTLNKIIIYIEGLSVSNFTTLCKLDPDLSRVWSHVGRPSWPSNVSVLWCMWNKNFDSTVRHLGTAWILVMEPFKYPSPFFQN